MLYVYIIKLIQQAMKTLKGFTSKYSTENIQNVEYYFKSLDMEHAIEYCKFKFSVPIESIQIIEEA